MKILLPMKFLTAPPCPPPPQEAQPLLSHPSLAHRAAACYHCLRWLPAAPPGRESNGVRFCGPACERAARAAYYDAESRGAWDRLEAHSVGAGVKFPLLAARLACGVLQGDAPAGLLDPLCRIAVGEHDCPHAWAEQHALLLDALRGAVPHPALKFLTLNWYCGVLSRCVRSGNPFGGG